MRDYGLTSSKFLSDQEVAALERTLHAYAGKDPRNTLIFFLLLYTGARPSEMLAVTKNDVNWEQGTIFLKGIKGSRDRDIPLPAWLFDKLKAFKRLRFPEGGAVNGEQSRGKNQQNRFENDFTDGEKLFPISYNTLGQIWREYRPCKKTLRSTRHTFAVRAYKKGKDARIVQRLLGHKWLGTTEIYLDYVNSQEEFRRLLCD